ncbi:MAG: signal peptidase I [Rhodobacterales bacterium CG2_30_65_12]|nr:MAG: signal peptidase I [Rhodobacterales bacterium CG2_30_65_12]
MAEKNDGIIETIKTIFWALLIAGLFRSILFQPFFIPTGSMKDTLLIGDFVFVNKMAYGWSKYSCPFSACPIPERIWGEAPERGDIVVFRHPTLNTDYVKRVIGLPGDRLQMKDGILYLNGEIAPQEPAGNFEEVFERQGSFGTVPKCANGPVGEGAICVKERATETLPGGRTHDVLNVENYSGMPDNTDVYTVPEGHFFFMGDNRDNSTDSRFDQRVGGVGMVPFKYLLGRVDRVMFSAEGKRLVYFWTWRSDRFFKKVE